MTSDPILLAQMAAYIDGEGCIHVGTEKYGTLSINITSTDPRMAKWLSDNFGGHVYSKKMDNRPKWRRKFIWQAKVKEAEEILTRCLPYFNLKRDQAEVALAFKSTFTGKRGRVYISEETWQTRKELRSRLSLLKRVEGQEIVA